MFSTITGWPKRVTERRRDDARRARQEIPVTGRAGQSARGGRADQCRGDEAGRDQTLVDPRSQRARSTPMRFLPVSFSWIMAAISAAVMRDRGSSAHAPMRRSAFAAVERRASIAPKRSP